MHPDDDPLLNRYHGADESESIRTLVTSTKIMLALAYDVLAASSHPNAPRPAGHGDSIRKRRP